MSDARWTTLDGTRLAADDPDAAHARPSSPALIDAAEAGDADARAELEDAFAGTLQFGTAGLRGQDRARLRTG